MAKSLGEKTKEGVAWNAFFGVGKWLFRFASSVVLARLLFPADFGLMGVITIVINFTKRFSSFGFNMVLVQKKDINDDHKNAVFYFNLFLEGLLALGVIFAAPYLAEFFNNPKVESLLYVMSLVFVLDAIGSVPSALLTRRMRFKQVGIISMINRTCGLLVPIGFALAGFGVWSLVIGELTGTIVGIGASYYFVRWHPRISFKFLALKEMFAFGIWVYINNLLKYAQDNIDYFFIGKFLGTAQLGFYERAFNLMNMPRRQLAHVINSVLFSAYSKIQEDNQRIIKTLNRVQTSISLIAYPLMIWLYFAAPSFITIVYGPKWVTTIAPLQIMCISGLLNTLTMTFFPVILAKGLVSQRAVLQGVYLVVLGTMIFIAIHAGLGIVGVAWSVVFGSALYLWLILSILRKHMGYGYGSFLRSQRSSGVYGGIQIGALLAVTYFLNGVFAMDSLPMFIAISAVSLIVYVVSHLIIRFKDVNEFFYEILNSVKKLFRMFWKRRTNNLITEK